MRRWLTLAAALVFSCSLHAAGNPALQYVQVTSPDLMSALQDIKGSLTRERTALSFENGASAKNCIEYSNLLSQSRPAESVRNAEISSEYLVCDSIRLISSEPYVVEKKALPGHPVKTLFEKLDLRSFPSTLRNRADDQKHTLKTLLAGKVKFQGNAVEIESDDQYFKMQIVGVVHRDGGKTQDWIVWASDEMKNGNYKSYRNLVVRQTPGGRYAATLHPKP